MNSTCNTLDKEYREKTQLYTKLPHGKEKDRLFEEKMHLLSEMNKQKCKSRKSHHSINWHRCVHDVSKKGTARNPYAVCSTSVGN